MMDEQTVIITMVDIECRRNKMEEWEKGTLTEYINSNAPIHNDTVELRKWITGNAIVQNVSERPSILSFIQMIREVFCPFAFTRATPLQPIMSGNTNILTKSGIAAINANLLSEKRSKWAMLFSR